MLRCEIRVFSGRKSSAGGEVGDVHWIIGGEVGDVHWIIGLLDP